MTIDFFLKTGYGNAEEQSKRSCGFCTKTGGDFSSLVLPVLGKSIRKSKKDSFYYISSIYHLGSLVKTLHKIRDRPKYGLGRLYC